MTPRPIKFRAKRTDNHPCYWAYGLLVKTPITAEFNAKDGQFFDSGWEGRWCIVTDSGVAHEIDITTLGQFTGHKDFKGKEIYEADILRYQLMKDGKPIRKYHYWEVFFDEKKGEWKTRRNGVQDNFYQKATNHEVGGNIYENSDLLK